MDLLRWIAEELNIFGLMIYSAGMILMVGALVLAQQRRRPTRKPRAKREPITAARLLNTAASTPAAWRWRRRCAEPRRARAAKRKGDRDCYGRNCLTKPNQSSPDR